MTYYQPDLLDIINFLKFGQLKKSVNKWWLSNIMTNFIQF